ncbi:hypothetical protein SLA2020_275990 [Shorea laevis]
MKILKRVEPVKVLELKMPVARGMLQSDNAIAGATFPMKKTKGLLDASSSKKGGGLFEDTPKLSLRDMLLHIMGDVECCLAWLDSGPSFPSCGLLGPTHTPSSAGLRKVRVNNPPKKKPKFGSLGSRPKVIFRHLGQT